MYEEDWVFKNMSWEAWFWFLLAVKTITIITEILFGNLIILFTVNAIIGYNLGCKMQEWYIEGKYGKY